MTTFRGSRTARTVLLTEYKGVGVSAVEHINRNVLTMYFHCPGSQGCYGGLRWCFYDKIVRANWFQQLL